jgi:hypothetical protein
VIDWSLFAIPKPRPRVLDRIERKQQLDQQERACRAAVQKRDKGKCVVPGCKDAGTNKHHIQYRSLGGKWQSGNVTSLCVRCHQLVHAGILHITGDADNRLSITGPAKYLRSAKP